MGFHYWSRKEWNSKKMILKDDKNINAHCTNIRSNRRLWVNFKWRKQSDTRILTCQSWHSWMPEFQSVASIMHVCTTSTVSANYLLDYFKFLINDHAIRGCPITVFICRTVTAWYRIWYSQGSIIAFDHDVKKRWSNEGEELNPPISQPQLTEIGTQHWQEIFRAASTSRSHTMDWRYNLFSYCLRIQQLFRELMVISRSIQVYWISYS